MSWARMRWQVLIVLLHGLATVASGQESAERRPYTYRVVFTHPERELIADLLEGPRGVRGEQSTVPMRDWYTHRAREQFGSWGPPARHYPAPKGLESRSPSWLRERVIATGLLFEGYDYQHHHVPDWSPPAGWPWKPVASGRNGKGVDCSNFTSFVYNLALGIKPNSDVKDQSALHAFSGPGGTRIPVRHVPRPESYDDLVRTLETGDLLYIKNREGAIAHVVLWVGPIGRSSDGTPLILDSHGDSVKDDNGQPIPSGVHLRPFRRNSWYHRSASHAIRVIAP